MKKTNDAHEPAEINRREFLTASAATAALITGPVAVSEARPARTANGTISSRTSSLVTLASGQLAGYEREGVHIFKGIPYAATTAGAARFKPPQPVVPWQGIRSSRSYGPVCPQGPRAGWHNDEEAFLMRWDDGFPGEDCLRVNVWTSTLQPKKLPVMVWLHGGGFTAGSGQELPAYDGERLARTGEVVLVSVNHRLGPLGFLDLSALDPEYAESSNVGMLDLVAALRWVRENITNFGGNPENVTIFGQSGGGAKVSTLMAMPAAKGLFHKAIVQSGSFRVGNSVDQSRQLSDATLAELNIARGDYRRLLEVPADRLIAASATVVRRLAGPRSLLRGRGPEPIAWSPTVDGRTVPVAPLSAEAAKASASIPMIIGTTRDEFGMGLRKDSSLTEAAAIEQLRPFYADKAHGIYQAFKAQYPNESPGAVLAIITSMPMRDLAIAQATLRQQHAQAPTWLYWFTYVTPSLDGMPGAFHCAELPFCFDNVARCDSSTGNTPEAHRLGEAMSRAWINFAQTGNPAHRSLTWPRFTTESVSTMVFDVQSRAEKDPIGAARRLLS